MGFWEIFLQIIPLVWDIISQQFGYIKDLNNNVATLMNETNALKRKRDEFEEDVKTAESIGKKKLRCVDNWFNDVDKILPEVDSIKLGFDQGMINPFSWHKLGKRVVEKMKDVKTLQDKGVFNEVAKSPRQPPVQEVPEQLQIQSTSEKTLGKIEQALFDEEIGIICVYGMGGIGKTTLMKAIYNKSIRTGDFDQVIWVTVSKDINLEVIQDKIRNKLEVEFHGNEDVEEKRNRLYARLSNLSYMLILDDLWQAFPLDRVGIPQPNKKNRCKIAITTRLIAVSSMMKADSEIKVKALSREEAWHLFSSNVGDVVLQPEIQPLAEEVVKECGGLPLAIKTVGAAMRRKDKRELWQNALRALRASSVPEVPGMEREVFLSLKLSYDYLEDPKIQLCFLYCSLYPEDYDILVKYLLRYWVFEEGLIDNVNSLDDAFDKAYDILEKLKDACLLEEGPIDDRFVRMHDLLWDLATWITSSCFQASRFLVKAGEGLEEPPEEKIWEGTGRISLMRNKIRELQMMPNCPNLVSLLLRGNEQLLTIHDNFFQLMPKLQVLDLSYTAIKSLPPSLLLLVNLRVLILSNCKKLQEMPPLGDLKELQLLDLFDDRGIENLPGGIASLTKLKFLDLSHTNLLAKIPCNMISGLTRLEDLRILGETQMSVDTWREVATLRRLTSLQIHLPSLDAFTDDDMNHPMWSRLTKFFVQFGLMGKKYSHFGRTVDIYDCQKFPSQIKSLTRNAETFLINRCQGLESLSQILGNSKSLKWMELREVHRAKCIVDWKEVEENNALGCLEELDLETLPSLQKVFDGVPPTGFQKLRRISICKCPKLSCIFSSSMFQQLNQLEMLEVNDCEEIEEILGRASVQDKAALQRLWYLQLERLPKLKTICNQQLVLSSVKHIQMAHCPDLKKLPVLCSSIQEIRGQIGRECWEGIEWEDDHSKSLYSTIYKETSPVGDAPGPSLPI